MSKVELNLLFTLPIGNFSNESHKPHVNLSREQHAVHSKHKKARNDRKNEKYNEERQERLKQLQIKNKEVAVAEVAFLMKTARENFEKYSRHELAVWKNCRNKDINKFETTNVREDLSSKISTLTYELNKTVTEFKKKFDQIVLATKKINEIKELESVYDNFKIEF